MNDPWIEGRYGLGKIFGSRGARNGTDGATLTLLTLLTRRGTRMADIPPLEIGAHHIAAISPHLVSPAISQKRKMG